MTGDASDRWKRIDEIFADVLTHPPTERMAIVRASCGDDAALARDVIALLDSLTSAEAAIGESVGALFNASGPLVEPPDSALVEGTRVGSYVVRRLIGRGGMGNVYAAVRADGALTREVALKVVRTASPGADLLRRLRQEQRILGALEHPRIARLYDGGVTADGSPFLVMELVHGKRIDEFVTSTRASLSQRLALFEEVCEAVAFAHQRLVVHRDLKPANILVGEDGHVRLLDFGIARLVAAAHDEPAAIGETVASTRPGHLVLTPEYAAPEQVRAEPVSVAMDVYALGVLLHELLTGARPAWQRLAMTRADDATIERAMIPPSRSIADPAFARAVRGDLDHVVLTALAPAPVARYPSAAALGEDVRRVREGFPILARRSTPAARALRLVRRNPWASVAWGAAFVAMLVLMTNTVLQGRRIARERDRANAERDQASAARDRANRARDRARTTSQLLASIFERADPNAPGRGDTLRVTQVLADGVERVNRDLATQPAARAELLVALGRAYLGLGRFGEAQALLDTARALQVNYPDVSDEERAATMSALGNLARARGAHADADSLFRASLALRTPVADAVPDTPNESPSAPPAIADSSSLADRGRAATLISLGAGLMERSRFDSARLYMDSGYVLLQSLPSPDSGALADYFNNRATLAMRSGDPSGAARYAGEAYALNVVRLGTDHPRVAVERGNLGFLLDRVGRSREAEPLLRESLRQLRERLPLDHPNLRSVKLSLGGILSRTGRLDEAERLIAEVVVAERAAGDDAKRGLPITLDNYAGVLEKLGRNSDALATYREAFALQRDLGGEKSPGTAILRAKVADLSCRSAERVPSLLGDFEQALAVLDASFPPGHPFRLGGRGQYGACLVRLGQRRDGERELLAAFDGARRAPPLAHGVARTVGRELLSLYIAPTDSARRILVQAQLDSLGVVPGTP